MQCCWRTDRLQVGEKVEARSVRSIEVNRWMHSCVFVPFRGGHHQDTNESTNTGSSFPLVVTYWQTIHPLKYSSIHGSSRKSWRRQPQTNAIIVSGGHPPDATPTV